VLQHASAQLGRGVTVQLFSALRGVGVQEAQGVLETWLK
jgi:hypothetical protein